MLKNMDPKQRKITISVVSTVGVIISYLVLAYFISWWPFGGTNANDIFKGIEAYKVDVDQFTKDHDAATEPAAKEKVITNISKSIKDNFIQKVTTFIKDDANKPKEDAKKTNFENAKKAFQGIEEEHKKLESEKDKVKVKTILDSINKKVEEFKTEFKNAFEIK